jgi:hypothetical protein
MELLKVVSHLNQSYIAVIEAQTTDRSTKFQNELEVEFDGMFNDVRST